MSTVGRLVLLLVALSTPFGPGWAWACVNDAECNNGDTCSELDRCIVGVCLAGGGGDTDLNLICDDEFTLGVDLKVTKLIAKVPAIPNRAGIRVAGDFIDLGSPGGAFTGAQGISVRVKDQLSAVPPPGDGIEVTMTFPAEECTTDEKGVVCIKRAGVAAVSTARFRRNRLATEQVRVAILMKGLDLQKPFFGPIRVILSHNGAVHRPGLVTDCKLLGKGINCREF